jgi:uncharacterized membrane protein
VAGGDDARLEALTEALRRLEQRQQEMEGRLARLEGARPPPIAKPTPPPAPPKAQQPSGGLETRLGLTLINRIGAVTLVLGVAFFFKYAVENRWIGEGGRVALGLAAGVAGLALGDRLWKSGQRIYAQGVSGASVAILYVSFYASAGWYRVLSVGAAFSGMALATIVAGALSVRYRSVAIAGLGLIGGYLTPVILNTGRDRPWFFLGYLLLLAVGALAIAKPRNWRGLEALALVGTFSLFLTQFHFPARPGRHTVLTLFALLYGGLFGTAGRVAAAAAQLAAMACVWGIWSGTEASGWQQAGFALLALALAGAQAGLKTELRHSTLAGAGVAAAMLAIAAPVGLSGYQLTVAWSLLAAFLARAGMKGNCIRLGDAAAMALLLVLARLYGWDVDAGEGQRRLAFFAAAAGFWCAAAWMERDWRALAAYVAGHFHLLWILGLEVLDWNRRTAAEENLKSVENASISILMALYAVVLIAVGLASRWKLNRVLGLALMAAVIVKLYAYDVWQLSRIYRFVAFAALGSLFLVASYLYSYYRTRSGPPGRGFWLKLRNRKV